MLACPNGWVSVETSAGWSPERVLPLPVSAIFSFGENASSWQPPTWKRLETGAVMPAVELSVPVIAIGSQLVGLTVKSGRLRLTSIRRIRNGIPSRIVGTDPTPPSPAPSWDRCPALGGPPPCRDRAGRLARAPRPPAIGRALIRPGQIRLARKEERVAAGARTGLNRADFGARRTARVRCLRSTGPGLSEIDASCCSEHSPTPASFASIPGGSVTLRPDRF